MLSPLFGANLDGRCKLQRARAVCLLRQPLDWRLANVSSACHWICLGLFDGIRPRIGCEAERRLSTRRLAAARVAINLQPPTRQSRATPPAVQTRARTFFRPLLWALRNLRSAADSSLKSMARKSLTVAANGIPRVFGLQSSRFSLEREPSKRTTLLVRVLAFARSSRRDKLSRRSNFYSALVNALFLLLPVSCCLRTMQFSRRSKRDSLLSQIVDPQTHSIVFNSFRCFGSSMQFRLCDGPENRRDRKQLAARSLRATRNATLARIRSHGPESAPAAARVPS